MKVSVWIDCGWARIRDHLDAHLAALRELGITRVCVMCNQPGDKLFNLSSFPAPCARVFAAELRPLGIGLTMTIWPRPTREYLTAMGAELPELAAELGADIELDIEGQWTETAAQRAGWSLVDAEQYLLGSLRPTPTGPRLGVTSHLGRPQWRIAREVDYLALQAYSYCAAAEPAREWHGYAGPGQWQRRAIREAVEEHVGLGRLIIGLAAWDQDWPGHLAVEAMQQAWEPCEGVGLAEVRYWSWTWIAGRSGGNRGYAYNFLKEKANEARQ
jgi:hypothetical protein